MRPGSIVIVDFEGETTSKRRLALVVSSEKYHRERTEAILAVVTDQINETISPTDYFLQDWQAANLTEPSAVRIFLFTLPQSKITEIGTLTERDWAKVKTRLQIAFDF